MPCDIQEQPVLPSSTITGTVTGSFQQSGLTKGGLITIVALDSVNWTPLPAVPLADRNSICIQNTSGSQIKLNYSPTVPGYVGVQLPSGGERMYAIKDSILLYAKAAAGTPSITVEELA